MFLTNKTVYPALLLLTMLSPHPLRAQEVVVQGMDVVETNTNAILDDELFGVEGGGYFHPYLSVGGEYTDNLFNVDLDTKTNFLTTITPGIWLSLPSRKEVPLHIAPNNTSAGGLQAALDDYKTFDRMNIYLLGGLTYKSYSEDSELNDFDARLEGMFKYNLRTGLSFKIVDSYNRNQDRFDIENNSTEGARTYHSNLLLADADWEFTEKLRAKVEYSNFYLDYDESGDEWLDRMDNAVSLYAFYKYSLKSSLFVEYRFVDVDYDISTLKDAEHHYVYGGFNWLTTDKTAFHFKLGYQQRDFKEQLVNDAVEASQDADNTAFAMQMGLDYNFTVKTKLIFSLNHDIEETDSFNSLDKKVLAGNIRYEQQFNDRFIGTCDLRYENADYTQITGPDRDDDRFLVRPALQYILKDWLMAELSYSYDTRDSSQDYYNYDTNTISFSLNSAL